MQIEMKIAAAVGDGFDLREEDSSIIEDEAEGDDDDKNGMIRWDAAVDEVWMDGWDEIFRATCKHNVNW